MDVLTERIKPLYTRYLAASLGSSLAVSIYSLVDSIAVGRSEGPAGAAAMAVITPVYGLILFLAILCGIGGAVLTSNAKGEGEEEKGNSYFSTSVVIMLIIALITWGGIALFSRGVLCFFGADDIIYPMAMKYIKWMIRFWPIFMVPAFVSAFIRNDGVPELAMWAVIAGGLSNILGDWLFVFPLGMGIEGAAVATVIGNGLQTVIMCSHFFRRKCGLKFVKPMPLLKGMRLILSIGVSSGLLDLGTVVLAVIMNNQVMNYGGATALAGYGVVATISSLIQSLYGGVGQAVQPLISKNQGAGEFERVNDIRRLGMGTVIAMGMLFTGIAQLFPVPVIKLFMAATPEVLKAAPPIVRIYSLLYLFQGISVLAIYYLQAIMQKRMAVVIAVLRGFVVSGIMLFVLPMIWNASGVWWAMPLSECIVAAFSMGIFIKQKAHERRRIF